MQVHLKKFKYNQKVQKKKGATLIYSSFITHKVKHFRLFFAFNLDDYGLKLRTMKIQGLKILEKYTRRIQKMICNNNNDEEEVRLARLVSSSLLKTHFLETGFM